MKKRSVAFGIVAFLLLVISVYVSFANSCNEKYDACIGQCGGGSSCNFQCYNEMSACSAAVWSKNGACVGACPRDDNYQPCQQNCIQMASKEDKEVCRPKYDECVANCNNAQACLDSCESNKAKCVEEEKRLAEEEEVPEEEEEELPPEEEEELPSEEEKPYETGLEDSEPLLDAIATEGMSREEVRRYYEDKLGKVIREGQNMLRDRAQEKFEQTRPLVLDAVNAKNDYEDALKKGEVSEEELAKLEADFNTKTEELKSKLNDVLAFDPDNVDALWGLGVINRWQGDNQLSYENYRDALVSQFHRNVFKFNDRLDAVRDPAMRMRLMQTLLPNENIANVQTTETSPFLKWFDDKLKAPVQQVNKQKRKIAEQIEKIANAMSLSQYLPKKLEELNEQ